MGVCAGRGPGQEVVTTAPSTRRSNRNGRAPATSKGLDAAGRQTPASRDDRPDSAGSVAPVTSGERARRRTTARGEATRARMISSAADLMYVRGVNAVTLDDVRAATGTSKSQLYKHFPDGKPELVRAVVALRGEQILAREEQRLARLKTMSGLRRWRDALVQGAALQGGAYGCALGNLVVELSDQDEQARTSLSTHFATWEGLLANGFRRMQDDGILPASTDPDALATGLMAALQGGYLLAQANHDVSSMAIALDMALAHIESLTTRPTKTAKQRKTATSAIRASATQPRRKAAAKR
jgi:TetR/AcrR family transcriptional repressor of nem operon